MVHDLADLPKGVVRFVGGQPSKVRATIDMLRALQARRAAGATVYLKTDPAWLLDMAINRRAGWVEDPHAFGSVQPVNGRLPRFATGDAQRHLHFGRCRVRVAKDIEDFRRFRAEFETVAQEIETEYGDA